MRGPPAPTARAASTKSREAIDSVAARVMRAKRGMPDRPTARAAFHSPTPSTATMRIARMIGGKHSIASISRAPTWSTRPPP